MFEDKQFEAEPIEIDTASFLIKVDRKFMPNVKVINEYIPEEVRTHALVSELAYELYYAKSALEDAIRNLEMREEEVDALRDEISYLNSDNEMLRDELDNV